MYSSFLIVPGRIIAALLFWGFFDASLPADGLVLGKLGGPKGDAVSEKAQEAMIVFCDAPQAGKAFQDLILRIRVEGDAEEFAWVIPLPGEPEIAKADAVLFDEAEAYVQWRRAKQANITAQD